MGVCNECDFIHSVSDKDVTQDAYVALYILRFQRYGPQQDILTTGSYVAMIIFTNNSHVCVLKSNLHVIILIAEAVFSMLWQRCDKCA